MTDGVTLAERLLQVRAGIADAARDAARDASTITTIVVTKFHPASMVRELHGLGVRDFGESRHQEAQPKVAELADLEASWHFVGQLQSKKARQVASYIDVLHSMDRDSLADALVGNSLEVFLQVNLTDDPGRGGIEPGAVQQLAE
ncbi:MAG: YggS family pyridoxal phosphate-dependent enzyme, partial [Salinibacterium sp.]|nr:YggS family pyridoxal phosphate-dependent enzyme [Salinibacterium sp.]